MRGTLAILAVPAATDLALLSLLNMREAVFLLCRWVLLLAGKLATGWWIPLRVSRDELDDGHNPAHPNGQELYIFKPR